mgnify:CR=1 FL=1
MNVGQKIQLLKESMGFKNYQEFGKFVGLSGDWCLELSKKKDITTIDITRLITICNKFKVTLDWLLFDVENINIDIKEGYPDNDVGTMLDNIIKQAQTDKTFYYGTELSKQNRQLVIDIIEEVKRLIHDNL